MDRFRTSLVVAFLALFFFSGCEKQDEVTGVPEPPDDPTSSEADSLRISRNLPPLLANGIDGIPIVATVIDEQGRAMPDVGVSFTTTAGVIDAFATTNAQGRAEVRLISAASDVDLTATVTATTAGSSAIVAPVDEAAIGEAAIDEAAIGQAAMGEAAIGQAAITTANDAELPTPGARVVLSGRPLGPPGLHAAVKQLSEQPRVSSLAAPADVLDRVTVVMTGIDMSMTADPIIIPADGLSESTVSVILREATSHVPLEGEVVRFGATSGSITAEATTDETGTARATLTGLSSGALSTVTAFYGRTLTATASVTFSVLRLTLTRDAPVIVADGVSSTGVQAQLRNEEGNPVVGARIDFSTTSGLIGSPILTNEQGIAQTSLVAPRIAGETTITARFGTSLSARADVQFIEPPETATVLVAVDPPVLPSDGRAQATLEATLLDPDGNPMPDGTPVTFTVVSGDAEIIGSTHLTEDGIARATLVAGRTPGTVTVRAASGSVTATAPIQLVPGGPGSLALSADQTQVLADGIASSVLQATATDQFGNPVLPGTDVGFVTTRGRIVEVTPTDASGIATARLVSERFETGLARVTASSAALRATLDVDFISGPATQIVVLNVERAAIGVKGASDPESSTLLFEMRDANGIPVDLARGARVDFSVRPLTGATDATIFPAQGNTNERGEVATTVNSGNLSGVVEVVARSGSIVSQPIRVAIHGGLPDPEHFSISFEKLNIAGLVYDGLQNGVTARVGDLHGNPVPDSTSVWFYADHGIIQGSDGTDDHAEATVWEITAAPHPLIPGGDGLVEVCARTVSSAGLSITECGLVMWSGPTIVEILDPPTIALDNGGSVRIVYRVRDANFNPLTEGTTIDVSSSSGDLQGDTSVELPDTQSVDYTVFEVFLLDDDVEQDELRAVTVTVSVTSQNGNGSASVSGTMR